MKLLILLLYIYTKINRYMLFLSNNSFLLLYFFFFSIFWLTLSSYIFSCGQFFLRSNKLDLFCLFHCILHGLPNVDPMECSIFICLFVVGCSCGLVFWVQMGWTPPIHLLQCACTQIHVAGLHSGGLLGLGLSQLCCKTGKSAAAHWQSAAAALGSLHGLLQQNTLPPNPESALWTCKM